MFFRNGRVCRESVCSHKQCLMDKLPLHGMVKPRITQTSTALTGVFLSPLQYVRVRAVAAG